MKLKMFACIVTVMLAALAVSCASESMVPGGNDTSVNGGQNGSNGVSTPAGNSSSGISRSSAGYSSIAFSAGPDGYGLVWSDEFDGPKINTDMWKFDMGSQFNGWGNWELEYYTDRSQNARIENGSLVIEARKENYQGYTMTSARMKTKGRMEFRYGRVEARIKMPNANKGLWPAFWMLGADIDTNPWPFCGELDIAEMGEKTEMNGGVARRVVHGTPHWGIPGGGDGGKGHAMQWPMQMYTNDTPLDTDYHIYSMEWDDKYVRCFVDGNQYQELLIDKNQVDPSASLEELQSGYFFILLNIAAGGMYSGITDANLIDMSDPIMKVDYVRVYQKNPDIRITVPTPVSGSFGIYTESDTMADKLNFGSDTFLYFWNNFTNVPDTAYEGGECLSLKAAPGSWFGAGIKGSGRDMSLYFSGNLHFWMKTSSTTQFKIGLKSYDGNEAWVMFTNAANLYGCVRDGQWHEVVIPLSLFNGVDFQDIEQYFMIAGEAPASEAVFSIDHIWFEEGRPIIVPASGNFGVMTETTLCPSSVDFATDASVQIWNNFTQKTGTPQEGSSVLALQAGGGWFGLGVALNNYADLSAYGNGNLVFWMKTSSTMPFKIGAKSGTARGMHESWIQFVNGADPYGFVRDNTWRQVKIPLSAFSSSDLSRMNQLFMLAGDNGPFTVEIDNMYFEL